MTKNRINYTNGFCHSSMNIVKVISLPFIHIHAYMDIEISNYLFYFTYVYEIYIFDGGMDVDISNYLFYFIYIYYI